MSARRKVVLKVMFLGDSGEVEGVPVWHAICNKTSAVYNVTSSHTHTHTHTHTCTLTHAHTHVHIQCRQDRIDEPVCVQEVHITV